MHKITSDVDHLTTPELHKLYVSRGQSRRGSNFRPVPLRSWSRLNRAGQEQMAGVRGSALITAEANCPD